MSDDPRTYNWEVLSSKVLDAWLLWQSSFFAESNRSHITIDRNCLCVGCRYYGFFYFLIYSYYDEDVSYVSNVLSQLVLLETGCLQSRTGTGRVVTEASGETTGDTLPEKRLDQLPVGDTVVEDEVVGVGLLLSFIFLFILILDNLRFITTLSTTDTYDSQTALPDIPALPTCLILQVYGTAEAIHILQRYPRASCTLSLSHAGCLTFPDNVVLRLYSAAIRASSSQSYKLCGNVRFQTSSCRSRAALSDYFRDDRSGLPVRS